MRQAFATSKVRTARSATSKIIGLVDAADASARVTSAVPPHRPLFEATPAEVWIDEYTPFHLLTVKLAFRNCDSVARRLKIEPVLSPFFKVVPAARAPDRVDGKIAAGMEAVFSLEFSPQDIADYAIDLVCVTERERFVLPVRARGRFAALDIPDEIALGFCPVRVRTTKVLTVRNVGTRAAKFAFRASEHFTIAPASAALDQGQAVQIELAATPPSLAAACGTLEIVDDAGTVALAELSATVGNVDVYLSQPLAEPSATYLSLSSRATIKICNDSEFPLEFEWKAFPDAAGDETERGRLLDQLARMEALELEQLQQDQDTLDSEDARSASLALGSPSPFDVRKTLDTKYTHLRKAAMEDAMHFVDECFSIAPLKGRVWAHSDVDIVVSFAPETELMYSGVAYLEIAGQEHRLPLQLRGKGIGPKAKVVYNELLDFGDVFISDERTRDFTIQNKGDIPADFELVPIDVLPSYSLDVTPSRGTLDVNAMQKIEVTFCSQQLGEVSHTIRFALHGSTDQLTVRFRATVIPPVFHFDTDLIDFGQVSYSFTQSRVVKLINASKIAMRYSLRIPEEANYKQKELELVPASGKLSAYGEEDICVNFTPMHVKQYDYQLVVGVPGVGTDLLSIPVRAQSLVPELTIEQSDLDFGNCFLRYPHKQTLEVENRSPNLFGRFEIGEQDDHSRAIATYTASEFRGVVRPNDKVRVDIDLACEKIGSIRLPMLITVPGSIDLPLAVTLTATGCGPKVEIDQPEINWGSCACLIDHERVLRMTNTSLISASYKTFIRNARSKFQVNNKEGVLSPGEKLDLVVTANLDDTVLFKDQLYILIADGDNIVVPLSIKGTGTTMWSPSELRVIDFGHQMTHRVCEWKCTLENKGKRVQVLTWVNKAGIEHKSRGAESAVSKKWPQQGSAARSGNSKFGKTNQDNATGSAETVMPVFSVFPGTIELKPRTACVFVFKGLASTCGLVQEDLVCEVRVGKEKTSKVAFATQIRGIFVDPKLERSLSSLAFEYIHYPGNEVVRQSQPLTLTNVCELPLSFTMRTQTPFSLDCWEASLQPGEKVDFNVEFYPGFKEDFTCRVIHGKVLIVYTDHPQKDNVELVGDISFPNLSFEMTKIDFGCTLNDTQKSISMAITNVSKVDTTFRWVFIEDDKETQSGKKPSIPINQVFDILPIRGLLKPNESENVEFIYYGHANRKFKCTVACEVDGGPEYEVVLLGEASSLAYKLDRQSLDFGQVLFNKLEDRDFSITNVGKVPFAFNITADKLSRGRFIEITPTNGRVAPGEKSRILVRLRPGVPEAFDETLVLEIAHFQPIEFKLLGTGTFSSVTCNLPRENHASCVVDGVSPNWPQLKKRARQILEQSALKLSDSGATALTAGSTESASSLNTSSRKADRASTSIANPFPAGKSNQQLGSPPTSPNRVAARNYQVYDDVDVEAEACRLFFSEYLMTHEIKKGDPSLRPKSNEGSELARSPSEPAVASTTQSRTKPSKKREPQPLAFVLSQFVLDFGNIVLGTHKVKKLSITNIGRVPVSFQLDKNLASSRGFQIEPERVVRLPEKQTVEFTVTFQARKDIDMGFYEVQLPVVVKNGPPCVLMMRATVTVPDISVSTESLDFGKVAVGTCHTIFTQLQNSSAVPAEWAFKKPMGSARDVTNFRFTPQFGVLPPGTKVNIQVEFIPDDGRHFMLKLPIKVVSNTKSRSVVCRGEGSELRLAFSPQMVDLGPVLPCDPLINQIVEIRNESDYPVEVFSLDFDHVFAEDEALLRSLDVYNTEGILQLPVRKPGQPLRSYIQENGLLPCDVQELTLESVDLTTKLDAAEGLTGPVDSQSDTGQLEVLPAAEAIPFESTRLSPASTAVDYVLIGMPRCGKTTQANLLAEKENLKTWTIDEAIKAACESEADFAHALRSALHLDVSSTDTNVSDSQENSEPAQESETDTCPTSDASSGDDELAKILPRIVTWRLLQPDMQRGSVLDGFESTLLPVETVTDACSQALAATRVVVLSFSEDAYDDMSAVLKAKNDEAASQISPIGESIPHTKTKENIMSVPSQESLELEDRPSHGEVSSEEPTEATPNLPDSHGDETIQADSGADEATTSVASVVETPSEQELCVSFEERFDALIQHKREGNQECNLTYQDYASSLDAQRQYLTRLFVLPESSILEHPVDLSDMESRREIQRESENQQADARATRSRHSNTLIVDIPISEVTEPLFVHTMIVAAIDKHVREVESQHLVIPKPSTYQLIRRPPERFPRKPITCFSIAANSASGGSVDTSESCDDPAHDNKPNELSRPQTPVGTLSRPQTAGKQSGKISTLAKAEHQSSNETLPPVVTPEQPLIASKLNYRWIIAPRSKVDIEVQFGSSEVGIYDCSLGFEVAGASRKEYTLFARGTCTVPTINSDPRNVFMSRIKSRPETAFVTKKFVMSLGQFEFGPLIVSRHTPPQSSLQHFMEWKKSSPGNIEVFRLSNTSRSPIHLDIGLGNPSDNSFAIYPYSLDLGEGETGEVLVWASPSTDGLLVNSLVCCIQDNPEPVIFPMTCYGCTPCIALRGPWEQPSAGSTSEAEDCNPSVDPQTTSRSDQQDQSMPILDFEKLLLQHQEDKTFFIENVSPVSVLWRLQTDSVPSDFRLFPVEGVVKPMQKTPVLVGFTANSEGSYRFELPVNYSDAESALDVEERRRCVSLTVCGEAYKIDICTFEDAANGIGSRNEVGDGRLEFGLVRVGERHTRSFTIRNRGKYNIKHVVSCRTMSSRELFTIEPSELILEPDQTSNINVTFQAAREIVLHDCKDIKCTIIEMISGEPCREFLVHTSAHAVYSKFQLLPNRGINFGPNKFNDQAKAKRIEVRNDGDFPFKFRVAPNSSQHQEQLTIDTVLRAAVLSVGQFSITPDCGTVDPGSTVPLDVTFQPKDNAMYSEIVRFEISGRCLEDEAESKKLLYELIGESCYPGINVSDYDTIFEEQIVVRSIDGDSSSTVVSASGRGGASPLSVIFAENEKVFSFGAIITAANSKGSVERFKIANPTKISSTVRFNIVPKVTTNSTTQAAAVDSASQQVFTVQPSMWEIPPLEHRFVSVYFRPPTIATYHATFSAEVEDGPQDSDTLEFELRGEGTLPCIAIAEPTNRDQNGVLLANFGRVRVCKVKDLALTLRNDGVLAATVLFSIQANPNFLFALGNGSIIVAPKSTETLPIQFRPQRPHDEPTTSLLKIAVQNNPFEETTIRLFGSGYKDDLGFEDLPFGHDDQLYFNDISLSAVVSLSDDKSAPSDTQVFSLWNHADDLLRFEFPKDPSFSFYPSVGHLQPGGRKMITATFKPVAEDANAVIYQSHPISVSHQRIAYKASTASLPVVDWDNSVQEVAFGDGASKSTKSNISEPGHTSLSPQATLILSCFAAADVLSFESDTTSITFRRTFMFQVCAHRISVHNKSKIRLPYCWRWSRSISEDRDSLHLPPLSVGVDEDCPFEIEPSDGVVPPQETQEFMVKFSPMEVDDYHYVLGLETAKSTGAKSPPLEINVQGSSLRPACHFDVERSDYAERRGPGRPGPFGELGTLDPSIKVIEMESLGVRVRNTRRFYVVNPTNVSYEFSWVPQGDVNACFRCATPKGLMLAGKRCEMIFEFTPQHLELQEMFWYFRIPHFQVDQLFLFVGTTVEPRVTLDRGSINFNTLLIGSKATQTVALINYEHIPFNFVLDKSSLDFSGETPALVIHPLNGVIAPNSRTTIDIEFIPTEEKSYNFNINCIVKRKPTRVSLNVKGEGYSIHDSITAGSGDQSESQLVTSGVMNLLDFGLIRVNEEVLRTVVIHNNGKFNFEFNWSFIKQLPALSIEPMQGTIKKNDRMTCRLVFTPTKQISLDGAHLTCTIAGSKVYTFVLQGTAVPPSIQFSFTSFDFGACFVADPESSPIAETVTLVVTNLDPEAGIDLDCLFDKKPHLRVDCPPTTLGPRESVNVPITFVARQEISYLEMIPFSVNGTTTLSVSVRGEGTLPRIELVNSSMKVVTFGSLRIGQQLSRTVKIINRSKRKANVQIEDASQPGVPSFAEIGLSVLLPDVTLKPKESADIEFKFSPTQRVPSFQKDVVVNIAGCRKKLLVISGCCQGMEVSLETDMLSFGAVCLGSQLVRKVRLQNRGDMPAHFRWNPQELAPDFSISPTEGVVAPNHHKTLEMTFKPKVVNGDIRYDCVKCAIDGTSAVALTLVGSCVNQAPSSIQDLHFDSPVREVSSKAVTIENKTATPWNLLPVVQGEYWSCQENVAVPANGTASLDVAYYPLRMTQQGNRDGGDADRPEIHQGSIFLAIPDGSALLYNLFGKASAPATAGSFTFTTPAKKTLPISIPIKNWLRVSQSFVVEIQKPSDDKAIVVQAPTTMTLQGLASRNYSLKFFSYTEGTVNVVVRMVNPDTSEYIVYEVVITVSKAAEVETLHLEAPVRQSVKKTITIENPFGAEQTVHFTEKSNWWKCSNPCIRVKQLGELNGRHEGCYEIEYRPIVHSPAPVEDYVTISFVELGEYLYKLVLTTQPAATERVLTFKAPLGGSQTESFEFVTFANQSAEIDCTVDDPGSFSIPTVCKVDSTSDWDGKTCVVPVKFEPEALGEFRDVLTLRSAIVGEYKCALHGLATPPLPQGPFVFTGSVDIDFKNVFSSPKDFEVMMDNSRFVLSTRSLSIPAKTSKVISVKFDGSQISASTSGRSSVTAKLFVSCPSMPEIPQWVYYLEAQESSL